MYTARTFDFGINLDEVLPEPGPTRFVAATEAQIGNFARKINAPSTDNSTDFAVKLLRSYCVETSTLFPEGDNFSEKELDKTLAKFYIGARTKKGELYKLNSMKGIRFSLQRYFLNKIEIDIINNEKFKECNTVFENVLKAIKASGKGETKHYAEIEPEDLQKLFENMDVNNPTGLQELVWFNIMYFLIRRGRENMRKMDRNSFSVSQDASGKKFIFQNNGELDKNHGIGDNNNDTTGEGRIYETKTAKCPVAMFLHYISLLNPNQEALWQKPRNKTSILDKT